MFLIHIKEHINNAKSWYSKTLYNQIVSFSLPCTVSNLHWVSHWWVNASHGHFSEVFLFLRCKITLFRISSYRCSQQQSVCSVNSGWRRKSNTTRPTPSCAKRRASGTARWSSPTAAGKPKWSTRPSSPSPGRSCGLWTDRGGRSPGKQLGTLWILWKGRKSARCWISNVFYLCSQAVMATRHQVAEGGKHGRGHGAQTPAGGATEGGGEAEGGW